MNRGKGEQIGKGLYIHCSTGCFGTLALLHFLFPQTKLPSCRFFVEVSTPQIFPHVGIFLSFSLRANGMVSPNIRLSDIVMYICHDCKPNGYFFLIYSRTINFIRLSIYAFGD